MATRHQKVRLGFMVSRIAHLLVPEPPGLHCSQCYLCYVRDSPVINPANCTAGGLATGGKVSAESENKHRSITAYIMEVLEGEVHLIAQMSAELDQSQTCGCFGEGKKPSYDLACHSLPRPFVSTPTPKYRVWRQLKRISYPPLRVEAESSCSQRERQIWLHEACSLPKHPSAMQGTFACSAVSRKTLRRCNTKPVCRARIPIASGR
jgi:hypothetical protein